MTTLTGSKPGRGGRRDAVEPLLKSLRAGVYAYLILSLLASEGSMHGYRIMKVLSEQGGDVIKPSESTIYETLKKLEKLRLIEAEWVLAGGRGPPRKLYTLTDRGLYALEELRRGVRDLIRLLEGPGGAGRGTC